MLVIIDYHTGNPGSIANMVRKIGHSCIISGDHNDILAADRIILPGVGSFDHGMNQLESSGLVEILNRKVMVEKTPVLGICLGMQLFANGSEEGTKNGLGWIRARVKRFLPEVNGTKIRVPHIGWNNIRPIGKSSILTGMDQDTRFYFVHSYHLLPEDPDIICMESSYGENFVAGITCNNVAGVQFHPEKSHKYGMLLLKNFMEQFQ
jgi:imidazole glycerol-phosphate synthase subunit HisH